MSGALGGAGSALPAMALIAVTQRAAYSLGWARAGSQGKISAPRGTGTPVSLLTAPSQIQAAPLCPGWVNDYGTGAFLGGH